MGKINKKQISIIILSVSVLTGILVFFYHSSDNTLQISEKTVNEEHGGTDRSYQVDRKSLIDGLPVEDLDEEETNGLILMREEEKLARDVYTVLGEKWGLKIFSNIASAEQTHTDAVKALLDRYDIDDPVKNDDIGVYTSDKISGLFKDLTEIGDKSLLDALIVGATIEDLDIDDLNKLISGTDNSDIASVYEYLNRGSRNHMRAFIRQIEINRGSYDPQFISRSEFDEIISSEQERGMNQ